MVEFNEKLKSSVSGCTRGENAVASACAKLRFNIERAEDNKKRGKR